MVGVCILWKLQAQEQLADQLGLEVMVCHYPKNVSKRNPIEHRLFGPVSLTWAGKPLRTLETMLAYLRGTTTSAFAHQHVKVCQTPVDFPCREVRCEDCQASFGLFPAAGRANAFFQTMTEFASPSIPWSNLARGRSHRAPLRPPEITGQVLAMAGARRRRLARAWMRGQVKGAHQFARRGRPKGPRVGLLGVPTGPAWVSGS
jgi:hypothetical protein